MILNKFKNQKGAMFGLDARVALAIFGGLSVIAGAAVFSTISETNVTAMTTEFDNISKGYINFVFNTGVDTVTFDDLLSDSGDVGWSGPYLTMANNDQITYGDYSLIEGTDAAGADPSSNACVASGICYVWLVLDEVAPSVAALVDMAVDGGDTATPTDGNFRHSENAGQSTVRFKISRCQVSPCV